MAQAQPIPNWLQAQEGGLQDAPPALDWDAPGARRGRLRLRTLVLLRWLSVAGQLIGVLTAYFRFHIQFHLGLCLAVIAVSASVNVVLSLALPGRHVAKDWEATAELGFDIVQLGALLGLTGGLANPFCLLLIAPATVGAASLPSRQVATVISIAILTVLAIGLFGLPLPSPSGRLIVLPRFYLVGVWIALMVGILFTAGYAWQAAAEGARMELALAATQSVLAREQRLSALGGLAAAAAHELGTPLATVQIVAKELLRNSPEDDPVADDARLLMQQAERCRDILKSLSQRPDTGDIVHARLGLAQLLEEVAEPYRMIGPVILTSVEGPYGEFVPDVHRFPEAIHALSSFVENAADFAAGEVRIVGRFDEDSISVEVRDDGPGFSPDVLVKLGEPYVTSRPSGEGSRSHHHGMGLGFFIAKTLLERTGASVSFGNDRRGGAVIVTRWPRSRIEAPDEG
jgi:two-component system sensor histidine kinase RegB